MEPRKPFRHLMKVSQGGVSNGAKKEAARRSAENWLYWLGSARMLCRTSEGVILSCRDSPNGRQCEPAVVTVGT